MYQVFRVILGLYFLFNFSIAYAVRHPDVYQQLIQKSEIKAVAVVKKVQITDWEMGHQTKKVWFETIKALNDTTPKEFTGYCMSYKNRWPWDDSEPVEGGYIFHYPEKGEHVVVSVSENNAFIHSFSSIDKEMEQELMKNGLKNVIVTPSNIKCKK